MFDSVRDFILLCLSSALSEIFSLSLALPSRVMPRSSLPKHSSRKSGAATPWRTASIAPPRPRDLASKQFALPRGPWTPAELILNVLEEGYGRGWGEDGPDTRPNVELTFFVDVTTVRCMCVSRARILIFI